MLLKNAMVGQRRRFDKFATSNFKKINFFAFSHHRIRFLKTKYILFGSRFLSPEPVASYLSTWKLILKHMWYWESLIKIWLVSPGAAFLRGGCCGAPGNFLALNQFSSKGVKTHTNLDSVPTWVVLFVF